MSVSVTCPFCRSVFTIAEIPAAHRTPCPNCGESVPVSADASPASVATAAPPATATAPPPRTSGMVFISLGLTAVIVAGFALWFLFSPKKPVYPPPPPPPPATTPPRAMGGLKYVPKDSQIVVAVQPAALDQYAKNKGRSAEELLVEFGVPEDLLKQLRDAGLPSSAIQSLLIAVNVDDLRLTLVLTLREPLKDEAKFRDKLKAQGRDPTTVDLGGFPLVMAEPNDKTFVFALNEKGLATAKTPTAGFDDLRPAVRESVDKLSLSSIAWVATDDKDWAKLPQFKLLGDKGPTDLLKKLNGVRAVATGVSLEPDLYLRLSVRVNDSTVARDTADALREKLNELNPYVTPSGEWADVSLPIDPPSDALPKLKAALKK